MPASRDESHALHARYLETRGRVHVNELLRECGWRPTAGFHMPPKHPRR